MAKHMGWFDAPLGAPSRQIVSNSQEAIDWINEAFGQPEKYYYSARQFRDIWKVMLTSGLIPEIRQAKSNNVVPATQLGSCFAVSVGSGLNISINGGTAFIDGAYFLSDSPEMFTLPFGRSDLVLRLDTTTNDVKFDFVLKPRSVEKIEDALLRTEYIYELGLHTFDVPAGSMQVTAAMHTDQRLNMAKCGDGNPVCGLVGSLLMPDISAWYERAQSLVGSLIAGEMPPATESTPGLLHNLYTVAKSCTYSAGTYALEVENFDVNAANGLAVVTFIPDETPAGPVFVSINGSEKHKLMIKDKQAGAGNLQKGLPCTAIVKTADNTLHLVAASAQATESTYGLLQNLNPIATAASYQSGAYDLTVPNFTYAALSGLCNVTFKVPQAAVGQVFIKLNGGAALPIYMGEDPAEPDAFLVGTAVSLTIDKAGGKAFFNSGGGANKTLPPQIRNFAAMPNNGYVTLSWMLPSLADDYAGLLIVRKAGSAPKSHTDGVKININKTATTHIDADLTNDTTYYYRAYPYNSSKQYQTETTGAIAFATPREYEAVLAANTWSRIGEIIKDGFIPPTWKVGDTKDITLTTGEVLTLQIYGFNHDDRADGLGKARITFGLKHLMAAMRKMNITNPNAGGFTGSAMYAWLNGDLYNSLPSDLKALIKSVNKKTSAGSQSSTINTNAMKIFLFSEIECFGTTTYSYAGEGTQYPIFTDDASRIKNLANGAGVVYWWWERSPYAISSAAFGIVYTNGRATWGNPSDPCGVCFGFCI